MKNKNKKFNLVDVLLLFTVICTITFFALMLFRTNARIDLTQKETVTITLRIRDIAVKHSSYITNGDEIYFSQDDTLLGTVKYASFDYDTVEFTDKLNNASTMYKSPDKKSALLLVEAQAEIRDGECYISDKKINKADVFDVYVPTYAFTATVTKIENSRE